MRSEEQKIHEVHSTWIDAVNAGELDRLLTLMAGDSVFFAPGQAPFGRDGFSSALSEAHQAFQVTCISELEEVVVVGAVAYTRSRDALSVTRRTDGKMTRLTGHRITVYRQQPDGRWLLARDAHTLTPAKEPAPSSE